jgi:hypothetical protein
MLQQKKVIKGRVHGRFPVAGLLALLCLLAAGVPVSASSSSEEALRTRVEQLYAAYQQGDWSRVEKYLTKESKPIFRGQEKKPVLAHQIQSIKLDPGGNTATVVVQIPLFVPMTPGPASVPLTTQWRLVKGAWYLELARPDPNALQSMLGTGGRPSTPAPPPPPVVTDLKFKSNWVGLEYVHHGEVKVARFPFTNVSNHEVAVEVLQLGCDCLRLKTQQKQFKPGESGVLEFELDPSNLQFAVEEPLTIAVLLETQPGGGRGRLTIAALLEPGAGPPPRP